MLWQEKAERKGSIKQREEAYNIFKPLETIPSHCTGSITDVDISGKAPDTATEKGVFTSSRGGGEKKLPL